MLAAAGPALLTLGGAGEAAGQVLRQPDAKAPNPDAELIAMCAVIVDGHAELNRYGDLYDLNEPPHVMARIRHLVQEGHRLCEQAALMPAATMEGVKAKARALRCYQMADLDGDLLWSNHDELLAWSIARDLLGEAQA